MSGPKGLGLTRAVKKWTRIAEELEDHMMSSSSNSSISHTMSSMSKKRQLDITSTFIDIQQRQKRKIINPDGDQKIRPNIQDPALITLMKRHSSGVAIDETILDQLLSSSSETSSESATHTNYIYLGTSLSQHPFAIDALMHALYLPGGRTKSASIKMKCAALVAMAVVAAEKRVIALLDEEDRSQEWVKQWLNDLIQKENIDRITNVRENVKDFC